MLLLFFPLRTLVWSDTVTSQDPAKVCLAASPQVLSLVLRLSVIIMLLEDRRTLECGPQALLGRALVIRERRHGLVLYH